MRNSRLLILIYVLLIFVLCLSSVLITKGLINKKTKSNCDMSVYKNVYVTQIDDSYIKVDVYGNIKTFECSGLSEDINGTLCDVVIENNTVKSIDTKTETIQGKVLCVTEDYVEIEGYGNIELDSDFVIYDSDTYVAGDYTSLVIGYSLQDFIVAEKKICGAIKNQPLEASNIRVLIKTTGFENIFHDNVKLVVNGKAKAVLGEEEIVMNSGDYLELNRDSEILNKGRLSLYCEEGSITIESIDRGVGKPEYEGVLEISRFDEGLVIVNEIEIEEYLKKVVPSEMPSSYNLEALKCQAVCARSYAYTELVNNTYSQFGAHIDDSVQYQVYNNSPVAESTNQAIEETKGQVLRYNGETVKTYYYSTSCGSTTDVSLWGSSQESYPYFVAECVTSVSDNRVLQDEKTFEQFIKNVNENDYDYGCSLYRWSMYETVDEISDAFKRFSGKDVGTISDIQVTKRVSGGACVEVKVTGSKGETLISGESNIRAVFGNSKITMQTFAGEANYANLPSTFCIFEKVVENGKTTGFKITGGGYGHGIGMSQNAAQKMSETMNYSQILEFFYPNTTLGLIYNH